jgi:hypothetical protein
MRGSLMSIGRMHNIVKTRVSRWLLLAQCQPAIHPMSDAPVCLPPI